MTNNLGKFHTTLLSLFIAAALGGCDQLQNVASGVGSGAKSVADKVDGDPDSGADRDGAGEKGEEDPVQVAQNDPVKVRLSAFKNFQCSSNWGVRDGGWGLKAGTKSGVCTAIFPGATADYRMVLMAQLEFDGGPKFSISVDDAVVFSGAYPPSKGKVICDCPNWRVNCPDRIVPIDAGVHRVETGSKIEFYAEEVYPCGGDHGAYAKWHEIVLTPVD